MVYFRFADYVSMYSSSVTVTRETMEKRPAYGIYHVSNAGPATSWADLAKAVFQHRGRAQADVTPVSTEQYAAGRSLAPRPRNSVLDLAKLQATGFESEDAMRALTRYLTPGE